MAPVSLLQGLPGSPEQSTHNQLSVAFSYTVLLQTAGAKEHGSPAIIVSGGCYWLPVRVGLGVLVLEEEVRLLPYPDAQLGGRMGPGATIHCASQQFRRRACGQIKRPAQAVNCQYAHFSSGKLHCG